MAKANPCVILIEEEIAVPMTVLDGGAFEKGDVMQLLDLNTASGAVTASIGAACAGILAEEKIASDGRVRIPVWKRGTFKGTASGAITVGNPISMSQQNYLKVAATGVGSGACIIGHALETAASGETFKFRLTL